LEINGVELAGRDACAAQGAGVEDAGFLAFDGYRVEWAGLDAEPAAGSFLNDNFYLCHVDSPVCFFNWKF
jgi:hypothetical protein